MRIEYEVPLVDKLQGIKEEAAAKNLTVKAVFITAEEFKELRDELHRLGVRTNPILGTMNLFGMWIKIDTEEVDY
jgi:hypothetical protein